MVTVKYGSTYFLWHDLWEGNVCPQNYLELLSFAKKPVDFSEKAATTPLF